MKIRAAVARANHSHLSLETLDMTPPREDEILVRMVGVGLCHTDLSALDQVLPVPLPMVLGHEGAGVVTAVGSQVTSVQPGDHVVMTYDYCGHCPSCDDGHRTYCHNVAPVNFGGARADGSSALSLDGEPIHGHFFGQSSFASHVLCTQRNVVKVRQDVPLGLLGPLACGVQTGAGAVINSLRVGASDTLVVYGAGAVGLSAVMAAHVAQAARIIVVDVQPARLALALELGATHVINASKEDPVQATLALTSHGVTYAIDTSGVRRAMEQALASLAPRGTCVWLASTSPSLEVPVSPFYLLNGRKLRGVIEGDAHVPQTFIPQMIDWFVEGRFPFDRMVKTYAFERINEAIADSRSGATIKPVLLFDGA